MSALGRIHGRTVWGGCTGGGLACGSLTIHTHHAMGREPVVQFRVIRETLHPPRHRSRGTLISRLAETKIELHVEFGGAIFSFELVYCIDFTVSRSGELLSRAPARTFHVATPLCLRLSSPPCPHTCAQEPSSTTMQTIPNGRLLLGQIEVRPAARSAWLGLRIAHAAQQCLRVAGPLATPSSPSDEPGRLS